MIQALLKFAPLVVAVSLVASSEAQAQARCLQGYVWREARQGDVVCVTPRERDDAQRQNSNARNNREPSGGAYGPNTCRQGYVWREAFRNDVVCVTPHERDTAKRQNAEAGRKTARPGGIID
jgi:hypothetical protein